MFSQTSGVNLYQNLIPKSSKPESSSSSSSSSSTSLESSVPPPFVAKPNDREYCQCQPNPYTLTKLRQTILEEQTRRCKHCHQNYRNVRFKEQQYFDIKLMLTSCTGIRIIFFNLLQNFILFYLCYLAAIDLYVSGESDLLRHSFNRYLLGVCTVIFFLTSVFVTIKQCLYAGIDELAVNKIVDVKRARPEKKLIGLSPEEIAMIKLRRPAPKSRSQRSSGRSRSPSPFLEQLRKSFSPSRSSRTSSPRSKSRSSRREKFRPEISSPIKIVKIEPSSIAEILSQSLKPRTSPKKSSEISSLPSSTEKSKQDSIYIENVLKSKMIDGEQVMGYYVPVPGPSAAPTSQGLCFIPKSAFSNPSDSSIDGGEEEVSSKESKNSAK
ncbi:hypothetical protein SSS_05222 [Sarcoptes scabiei]|nr:hypothetical protein SSS_05222 [Sarcoptes scabiei]